MSELDEDVDEDSLESMERVHVDEALASSTNVFSNNITSTPVSLRAQALMSQGVTGLRTPMSLALRNSPVLTPGGRSTPLPRRTHVMLLPESNKENIDSQLASQAPSPSPSTLTLRNNLKRHYSSEDGGTEYDPDVVASQDIEDDGPRSSKKKGLRASDLNPVRKRIVQHAYPHFRLMVAKDSFPTEKQEYEWAMAAWYLGLGELVESHGYIGSTPPTQSEVTLITMRVSQLHGQVKIAARDTVDEVFHFKTSDINDDEVINATRALVVKLKAKKAFIYKDFSNLTLPASIFRSELIKKVLCKVWFGKQQDSEGITHPMYFEHGIPLGVLALICTALQCTLDEWITGVFTSIIFSEKTYQTVYEGFLNMLKKWNTYTATRTKATEIFQKELLSIGRLHGGCTFTVNNEDDDFSLSDVDFALQG